MIEKNIKNIKNIKSRKAKKYTEGEIVYEFNLNKLAKANDLLNDWLSASILLNDYEQHNFNKIINKAKLNITNWNEEDLKMYFISHIIDLSNLDSGENICSLFERTIEADVDGINLKIKPDFMIAKGVLDFVQNPYFHFQEYKKDKDPNGDPLGQLLQAFLIATEINQNGKPIYGAYIIGRFWYFVVFQNREYCVSRAFDSTLEDGLMAIIATLRRFTIILQTRLLVD